MLHEYSINKVVFSYPFQSYHPNFWYATSFTLGTRSFLKCSSSTIVWHVIWELMGSSCRSGASNLSYDQWWSFDFLRFLLITFWKLFCDLDFSFFDVRVFQCWYVECVLLKPLLTIILTPLVDPLMDSILKLLSIFDHLIRSTSQWGRPHSSISVSTVK